ncbi:sensor histidine kinase [Kitasatospora sp. NPDC048365]|uniref:sensor histidine kinase n=1 Tax=Kitasatospora sp. NPDC048365 TaxID=3364050 RepID=UPI003716AB5F
MERTARARAWLMARLAGLNPYVLDTLLALFSIGVSLWAVYQDVEDWPWWVYLLAASTAFALPWRRRHPFGVLVACIVPSSVLSVVAHSVMPQVQVVVVVAAYTLADRGRDWQRWLVLVGLVVGNIVGTRSFNGALFSLMVSVGAFVFGTLVRKLRRLARAEAERAHQVGLRAASDAARAVAEERARIAREMHDILAHAVSLMVIQAEAGPLVVRSDPDRAVRTFDTIADSGRDAMVQLRRVLGVLKEEGAGPQLAPQPRLAELPAVVERVRASGVRVDARIEDCGPADVQAAAYRIVQEALTNVVKHADAAHVTVRIARAGGALAVEVADDGRGPAPAAGPERVGGWSGGRGLVSIRERAAACGGTATAGPGPQGRGFVVEARLPLAA